MRADRLLVGLGNPGERYARTRHNIGFLWLERLAREQGAEPWGRRWDGWTATVRVAGKTCVLLRPATYMNRSGVAVQAAMAALRVPPESVLVAHDELDLSPGTLRFKVGGGPAGHNGIRSVIEHVGGERWLRLRMGIGHPGRGGDVVAWVLGRFSEAEQAHLPAVFDRADEALRRWLEAGLDAARQWLHSQPADATGT